MTRRVITSILLFFCLSHAEPNYQVLHRDDGRVLLTVSTPDPSLTIIEKDGVRFTHVQADDWNTGSDGLPFLTLLIHLPANRARLTLVSTEAKVSILALPPMPMTEARLSEEPTIAEPLPVPPSDIAVLDHLGMMQEYHLWSVRVRPFQYSNGTLSYIKNLVLEISPLTTTTLVPLSEPEKIGLQQLGAEVIVGQKESSVGLPPLAKRSSIAVPRVKILLNQDGIYRITGEDLKAIGVRPADVEIKKLHLTCHGSNVPIFVSGWQDGRFQAEDYIEFWGEALRGTRQDQAPDLYQDPFSSTNVYWLTWRDSPGIWLSEEQATPQQVAGDDWQKPLSFYQTVHVEADQYFDRLNDIQALDSLRDHLFFDSGIGAGSKKQYPFTTPWPDFKSPLGVLVNAWLSGRSTLEEEHQLSLFVNDQQALSGKGWRQSLIHLQTLPDQQLAVTALSANNHLTVINQVDSRAIDFVMLNWFEVTYPRLYRAHQGFIKFSIPPDYDPGRFLFQIDGFDEDQVDIYKLATSKMVGSEVENRISSDGVRSFTCTFADEVFSRETEYVAVASQAKKKPLRMEWQPTPWQFDESMAIDYLVVCSRRFQGSAALKKLTQHRQAQGYQVMVVTAEDLYDAFDEGRYGSWGLKAGLTWFYGHSSSRKLQYVLLVGDGCFLRNGTTADSLDLIPAHYRQTVRYGATASDYWYALLAGDDEIPDVHLGRLPVRKEEELQTLVDKIVGQETEPYRGDWRHRLLFIGGNGIEFRNRAITLAHRAPPAWDSRMLFTTRVQTGYDPFYGGTADLLDLIDEGCVAVNFHGHGGGAIWSDNGLLRLEDVPRMSNRLRYPLILSMTCFTGAFDAVTNQSLADVMLMNPDLGACAFLGASGLGWLTNDDLLQTEIMNHFYQHPQQTVGELIDAGKILYLARYNSTIAASEVNQYNLLGDPASRLMTPSQTLALMANKSLVEIGDTVVVSTRLPFIRGQAHWQLVDSNLVQLDSKAQSINGAEITASFIVPNKLTTGNAYLRLYAEEELGLSAGHGSVVLSTSGVLIDSVRTVFNQDTLYVYLRVASRQPLSSVRCRVLDDSLDMHPLTDGWYVSDGWLLPQSIHIVQMRFLLQEQDGRLLTSKTYSQQLRETANLYLDREKVRWSGTESPQLLVAVVNNGAAGSGGLILRLEESDPATHIWQMIAVDSLICPAFSTTSIALNYAPAPGRRLIRLQLDADRDAENGMLSQAIINLEAQAFAYQPSSGIVGADTLQYDDDLSIVMPAGTFSTPGVLFIRKNLQPVLHDQIDLKLSPPSVHLMYSKAEQPAKPVTLIMPCDTLGSPSIYFFSPATKKWQRQAGQIFHPHISAAITEWGEYGVLYGVDAQPPVVEIHVDGRPAHSGMLTSTDPLISILVQDQNGVDLSSTAFQLLLDGHTPESLALPDSIANANQVSVQGLVSLASGDHQLVVQAQDCYGNRAEPVELQLRVAADFQLQVLGNYPNPFAATTVFAYRLTLPAEKLLLKIYSTSGRMIRSIDARLESSDPLPLTADYHELIWDGTDDQGYDVANGVYFYRLTAWRNGTSKEASGKIARIR